MAVMRFNPVVGDPIGALFEGNQEGARIRAQADQRRALSAEGAALRGNPGALNELAGLNPQAYKGAVNWNSLNNIDQHALIGGLAESADTPEKWEAAKQKAISIGVPLNGDEPFSDRASVLEGSNAVMRAAEAAKKAGQAAFSQKMQLKKAGKSSGTTINVNTGEKRQGLTKPTRNKIQKDLDALLTTKELLKGVAENFDPESLTYKGQGMAFLERMGDKLGVPEITGTKRLEKQTEFFNSVNKVFNAYRKDITGAAASIQELESLKKAVFNTDQGPAEFRASYKAFVDAMNRAVSIKQELLGKGLSLNSDEFSNELDRRFLGDDTADTPQVAPPRRATNPTTGEVIELRNGKWVPVQ